MLTSFLESFRRCFRTARPTRRATVQPRFDLLENREMPAVVAGFDWAMQERFGQTNGTYFQTGPASGFVLPFSDGRVNLFNDPAYVQAKSFTVNLNAGRTSSTSPIASYNWTIRGDSLATPLTRTGAVPSVSLAEGFYYVTLTANAANGETNTTTTAIEVNDILIVSIGDSAASGEGVPDLPRNGDNAALWADGPNGAFAHRSGKAAPALAALELERSDPHTSVTFVSVAASGDSIINGLINPARDWQGLDDVAPTVGQIDQVVAVVGSRKIDGLTVTIGANDLAWTSRIPKLLFAPEYYPKEVAGDAFVNDRKERVGSVTELLADLPNRYDQLDAALKAKLNVGDVFISEYYDPTHVNANTFVSNALNDFVPGLSVDASEAQWAFDNVVAPLNKAISVAANKHGWTLVDGIDEGFVNHGYTAPERWVVTADESRNSQGPYTESSWLEDILGGVTPDAFLEVIIDGELPSGVPEGVADRMSRLSAQELYTRLDRAKTKGTLHPNLAGQNFIAQRMLATFRGMDHDLGKKDDLFDVDVISNIFLLRNTFDVNVDPIAGRTANDTLRVRQSPHSADFVEVTANGRTIAVLHAPRIEDLTIHAGGGHNTILVETIPTAATVWVYGGGGNDTISVGNNGRMDAIRGGLQVYGESGSDSISFNDTLNPLATTWTMGTPPTDGTVATLQRTGYRPATFRDTETVVLSAGSGLDTINIERTLHASRTNVYAGDGNDTINVGSGNVMDWIRTLHVGGDGGANTLRFYDEANRSRTYAISADSWNSTLQMRTPAGVLLEPITYRDFNTVSLSTGAAADRFEVNALPTGVALNIAANGGSDTVVGALSGNWYIDGVNGGSLQQSWNFSGVNNGSLRFTGTENLTGGTGGDTFVFASTGQIASLADLGGLDTLDYSGRTTPVTVNLRTNTATSVPVVIGIENVFGGSGNDTIEGNDGKNVMVGGAGNDTLTGLAGDDILIGRAGNDSLVGGLGRDILIGGVGADWLDGGADEDIAIGGSTAWDAYGVFERNSLNAIAAEWSSARSYASRVGNLTGATNDVGRLNGFSMLLASGTGATVTHDIDADTVLGGLGNDWLFAFGVDVRDAATGERVN